MRKHARIVIVGGGIMGVGLLYHLAEPIFAGEECIGITTSGAYGHRCGKSLGFGTIRTGSAVHGTPMEVKLLGERHRIKPLDKPAYDPANKRLKA